MGGYIVYHCPHCERTIGVSYAPISSGLGPPARTCFHCRLEYQSGRAEWPHLNILGKGWYVLISIFYVLAGGFLAGGTWTATLAYPRTGTGILAEAGTGYVALSWFLGICWGSSIAFLQVYRVLCSIRRAKRRRWKPYGKWLWNVQVEIKAKTLAIYLLVLGFFWFLGQALQ